MRINRQTASTDGTSTTRIRQFAPALNAAAVATALRAVSSSLNSSAKAQPATGPHTGRIRPMANRWLHRSSAIDVNDFSLIGPVCRGFDETSSTRIRHFAPALNAATVAAGVPPAGLTVAARVSRARWRIAADTRHGGPAFASPETLDSTRCSASFAS